MKSCQGVTKFFQAADKLLSKKLGSRVAMTSINARHVDGGSRCDVRDVTEVTVLRLQRYESPVNEQAERNEEVHVRAAFPSHETLPYSLKHSN